MQSFPKLGNKTQVSVGGTGIPTSSRFVRTLWGPNDESIIYLSADSRTLFRVPIETSPTFRVGRPEPLFRLPAGFTSYDSIDGERFLIAVRASETQQLTVVTNWAAELEDGR